MQELFMVLFWFPSVSFPFFGAGEKCSKKLFRLPSHYHISAIENNSFLFVLVGINHLFLGDNRAFCLVAATAWHERRKKWVGNQRVQRAEKDPIIRYFLFTKLLVK